MEYLEALKNRRSVYGIDKESTVSDTRLAEILTDAVANTPSAFNSRSSRIMLLLEQKHAALWDITMQILRKLVPAEKFAPTEKKIASFAAGHGTILYFEDQEVVTNLQEAFPTYSDNFPIWSQQSAGMLQLVIWTALEQEMLGASLQHYNPIIDDEVRVAFDIPDSWKLIAQMPFGNPTAQPAPINRSVDASRVRVLR